MLSLRITFCDVNINTESIVRPCACELHVCSNHTHTYDSREKWTGGAKQESIFYNCFSKHFQKAKERQYLSYLHHTNIHKHTTDNVGVKQALWNGITVLPWRFREISFESWRAASIRYKFTTWERTCNDCNNMMIDPINTHTLRVRRCSGDS